MCIWNPKAVTGTPYKSELGTVRYPKVGAWVRTAEESVEIINKRQGENLEKIE